MKENAYREHKVLKERECESQTLQIQIWNHKYEIVLVFNI